MKNRRTIAVIDLKAFYSYVECVDRGLDPWITPLVVADKDRGKNTIVLSVTPFLKAQGIPSRLRIKELPRGYDYIYAVPRMERYIEMSNKVIDIFMSFVSEEDIHVYSIDESFIDLTSYIAYYKMSPKDIVLMILKKVKGDTGLQATGGIGDNFFQAKVALDIYAKKEPNGIATLRSEDIKTKLWPIEPLSKIWGIGPRTEAKLNKLGMYRVKDVALSNKDYLINLFGVMGEQIHNQCNGIDEADMHEIYIPKERSLSIGQTLFKDYNSIDIKVVIREMIDDLSLRMRNEHKQTGVVSLYIGYSGNIGGFSRQMSLLNHSDDPGTLYNAVIEIFNKHISELPIRQVGINFGKLITPIYHQLSLFDDAKKEENRHYLQEAVDNIHTKYGMNKILRLSALLEASSTIERHSQIGGHRR